MSVQTLSSLTSNLRRALGLFALLVAFLVLVRPVDAQEATSAQVFTTQRLESEFKEPPREFTLMPFWFWNDELREEELIRQIDSFQEHGVYGFTIHPRIGLPEDSGWMSDKLLAAMRVALSAARERKMQVLLYDEGMYPSGSSAGQVVAEDPSYAARGFIRVELNDEGNPKDAKVKIEESWNLVETVTNAKGERFAIYDAPSNGVIRGLHYIGEQTGRPGEFSPPASDLLNPDAVDAFIRLVYQRFYDEFTEFFEDGTIIGIFTDEPSILGRGPRRGMTFGNLRALETINRYLGYDFRAHLLELWEDVDDQSATRRAEYNKAVHLALEESYYSRISAWCQAHNTSLCGHPESSSDVGVLNYFQIPGQDIVWRYVEPGEKAFDPTHSMMAKVASSVMVHNGLRRNLNEVFGAYGHEFTYEEMLWITNWCMVRGHNLLVPHAFFYSIRGPRHEERPPDVGPNSPWWDDYKSYADYCARLCWLNTDSQLIAPTAVLVDSDRASAWATRSLTERQLDYNYLELRALDQKGVFSSQGVTVYSAQYRTLLLPPGVALTDHTRELLEKTSQYVKIVRMTQNAQEVPGAILANNDPEIIKNVREFSGEDVCVYQRDAAVRQDAPWLRARHVKKGEVDFYLLFNEGESELDATASFAADLDGSTARVWNPWTGETSELTPTAKIQDVPRRYAVKLAPHETTIYAFEKR
ncbi:MAG: hypothetical protein Q4G03_02655 [Planctomycetia bacterium]|nr:hypothetical protein [Planctomycetia bacterium]